MMATQFLLAVSLYMLRSTAMDSTRNILQLIPEQKSLYNGGILYNFWVESNGIVYGNSYGVNTNTNSMTPIRPKTALITPNTDELCISVDVDYIYTTSTSIMFNPINIMLATSCKYCSNTDCTNPQWRILTMNLNGNTFAMSTIIEVAAFDYTTTHQTEIFVDVQKYGGSELFCVMFNGINRNLTSTYSSRIWSGYIQSYNQIMIANYNISTLEFFGHVLSNNLYIEYGLLTLDIPYNFPSYYPKSAQLYFTDNSIGDYFIHCHTVDNYGEHAINCVLVKDDTQEIINTALLISQYKADVFKHGVLLISIDNAINGNNNDEMTVCDLVSVKNLKDVNKGKFVIVYESGHTIIGAVYTVDIGALPPIQQYVALNEIPINGYNASYDPVVTVVNESLFVVVWAVKQKGIYAALYDNDGIKMGNSASMDLPVYEDNLVNYTWLDLVSVAETIFISFTVSNVTFNSKIQLEVIYLSDFGITPQPTSFFTTQEPIDHTGETRSILVAVPEHNSQYDTGVLYSFWVGFDGNIYGRSYGIDAVNNIMQLLPITALIMSNTDELCVAVGADYIYGINSGSMLYSPVNIMLAASCRYCLNDDCTLPQWRIVIYNINGDTFDLSTETEVAAFDYTINNMNDILVYVQRYGGSDVFGIMFNSLNKNLTSAYSSRLYSGYELLADSVMMANYNATSLEFIGHVTVGNVYVEYQLLSKVNFPNDWISLYPKSTEIYFSNTSITGYFIHCHTTTEAAHIHIDISCVVMAGNTEEVYNNDMFITQYTSDIFKHDALLITIDNELIGNKNDELTVFDLTWIRNLNEENKGKFVVVYESGNSIFGAIYELDDVVNVADYVFLDEIPMNSYNVSYNPVVTAAPITGDIATSGEYFVIAWIVKNKGIYAALYDGEGVRIGLSNYSDIIIYENDMVNYTWLDIECMGHNIFISFTMSNATFHSEIELRTVHLSDFHPILGATRSILLSVPEYNDKYDAGILYSFWIGFDGAIYGDGYGIHTENGAAQYSKIPFLPTTELMTPNKNELCVSVAVDYIYSTTDKTLMFSPLNIMMAISCKYCVDQNCVSPQWRVLTFNLNGITFDKSNMTEVAAFDYTIPDTNDIFVQVQRFGDNGLYGIIFNGLLTNITSEYVSRIAAYSVKPYDLIIMGIYNMNTLQFVDNGTLQTLSLYPFDYSLYPTTTPIFDLNKTTNYFIECHSEISTASIHHIGCAVYTEYGEFYGGGGIEQDVFEKNALLISVDNMINNNNNKALTMSHITWTRHTKIAQFGKMIIVYQSGNSIFAEIYEVAPIIALQQYNNHKKIKVPINAYNSSYNPVVTAAPILQNQTSELHGKYFVIAWAVLEKGIYASIFGPEGSKIGYSQNIDIEIYADNSVNYTWLDIICIEEAIYITFITTDFIGSTLQSKTIYITHYFNYDETPSPTLYPSKETPNPTTAPFVTRTSIQPTSQPIIPLNTTAVVPTTTINITTNSIGTTIGIECIFEIIVNVEINFSIIVEPQQFVYDVIFSDTVIHELKQQYTIGDLLKDSIYQYIMKEIQSSFKNKRWFYRLQTLLCVEGSDNALFDELQSALNHSVFWNAVETELNDEDDELWPDTNSQINGWVVSATNNNIKKNVHSKKIKGWMIAIIIILILLGILIIALFVYWLYVKKKRNKQFHDAAKRDDEKLRLHGSNTGDHDQMKEGAVMQSETEPIAKRRNNMLEMQHVINDDDGGNNIIEEKENNKDNQLFVRLKAPKTGAFVD